MKLIRYRRIATATRTILSEFLYQQRHDRISEIVMIERIGGIRSNMLELIDELILMRVPIPLDININNGARIFGNAHVIRSPHVFATKSMTAPSNLYRGRHRSIITHTHQFQRSFTL